MKSVKVQVHLAKRLLILFLRSGGESHSPSRRCGAASAMSTPWTGHVVLGSVSPSADVQRHQGCLGLLERSLVALVSSGTGPYTLACRPHGRRLFLLTM
jgi:hypothetical protein